MTVAHELAEFLTETSATDLPPQAIEHAAMLIASTLASAAMGSGLASSAIIRSLARERSGIFEASLWFDTGPKLPAAEAAQVNAVMSDAAASDDTTYETSPCRHYLGSHHARYRRTDWRWR